MYRDRAIQEFSETSGVQLNWDASNHGGVNMLVGNMLDPLTLKAAYIKPQASVIKKRWYEEAGIGRRISYALNKNTGRRWRRCTDESLVDSGPYVVVGDALRSCQKLSIMTPILFCISGAVRSCQELSGAANRDPHLYFIKLYVFRCRSRPRIVCRRRRRIPRRSQTRDCD